MNAEHVQEWPGAADADDAWCTKLHLNDQERQMYEGIEENLRTLGVLNYQEEGVTVIHGIVWACDIAPISRGEKPPKRPFPGRVVQGYNGRLEEVVIVRGDLL